MDDKARSQLQLDLAGAVVRPPTLITSRSFKTSPALTPTNSPSCRRSSLSPSSARVTPKIKTPRPLLDARRLDYFLRVTKGRRLVPWLVFLVVLWTFAGFHMQNRWPNNEHYKNGERSGYISSFKDRVRRTSDSETVSKSKSYKSESAEGGWLWKHLRSSEETGDSERIVGVISREKTPTLQSSMMKEGNRNGGKTEEQKSSDCGTTAWITSQEAEELRQGLDVFHDEQLNLPEGMSNNTVGKLVGPYEELEIRNLGRDRFIGQCETESLFANFVSHKEVVVVLHDLSITGAPLSMLELATKMRICGARVSAVILNKAGGLYSVLEERDLYILKDKTVGSWNAAGKADLVVVGSAACASWVGQYLSFNKKGSSKLVWWLMENRREYFDRAKNVLGKVRSLIFLSEGQAKLWTEWYSENGSTLTPDVDIISLSVNDELASVAGLTAEPDNDVVANLRREVRQDMGLEPEDLLLVTLSSINSGKGQFLLLEAASMVVKGIEDEGLVGLAHLETNSALEGRSRKSGRQILCDRRSEVYCSRLRGTKRLISRTQRRLMRKIQPAMNDENDDLEGNPRVRLLIGSVGSRINKPSYMEKIARFLDQQPQLAKLVFSVPVTTHVAPLYAAADAYVLNTQGIGETFGRVSIEAMAFGLPVLATNAGGPQEIIEANITGLLHPIGRAGIPVLAQHIRWLLEHKEERQQMGRKGREKVNRLFREDVMYEKLAKAFMRMGG